MTCITLISPFALVYHKERFARRRYISGSDLRNLYVALLSVNFAGHIDALTSKINATITQL